jgi:hypothetical protein
MPPQEPQLRDIHVPQVSWWPLAPGWWVLAALVVLALLVVAWLWRRRARRRQFIDAVLADLHDARARHASDGDSAAFAATAHALLRRVARTRDPHSVTSSANAWHDALAGMAPSRDVSRLVALGDVIYQPRAALDVDAVHKDVEVWVRDVLSRGTRHARGRAHVAS